MNNSNIEVPNLYAQVVSSSISPYDATLIFHQVVPSPVADTDFKQIQNELITVSKISLSHRTLIELADLINNQVEALNNMESDMAKSITITK